MENERHEETEFVVLLREYMAGSGVEKPADLWRMINELEVEGMTIPWSTFYSYFEGIRPSRWFVRAVCEALGLGQRRRLKLYDAYFKSYN